MNPVNETGTVVEEPIYDYKHKEPLRCRLLPIATNLKPICGHKLDTTHIPKRNCDTCWKLFFIQNQEMTQKNLEIMRDGGKEGEAAICYQLGNKYLKQIKRFAVFIYEVTQKLEEKQDGKEVLQGREQEELLD